MFSTIWYAVLCRHTEVLRVLLAKHVRPDRQDFEAAQVIKWQEGTALLAEFSYEDVPEREKHDYEFVQRKEREAQAEDRDFVSIRFDDYDEIDELCPDAFVLQVTDVLPAP
ncbi:hypothetical protein BDV19DRAFT_387372 [Aspergillus venezuelensis]